MEYPDCVDTSKINRRVSGHRRQFWVTCPDCKEGRWVDTATFYHKRLQEYTGCCRSCMYARRRGQPRPAIRSAVGGRYIDKQGYVMVRPPGAVKYVLEHRLIMAEHLGRELMRYEIIRHINGDKSDNRIENLEIR